MTTPAADDPFYAATSDERASLSTLLNAGRSMREEAGGIPSAASHAMADLESGQKYVGEWWDDPAGVAQSVAGALLVAGEDNASAQLRLTSIDPPAFYADCVLARAAIEAFARAHSIVDTRIPLTLRIARAQNERIESLMRQAKIPGLPVEAVELARQRCEGIHRGGAAAGFARVVTRKGKETDWLMESRLGSTDAVRTFLSERGPDDFGDVAYAYFSMFTHSTLAALMERLEMQPETLGGFNMAVQRIAPQHVNLTLAMTRLAYMYEVDMYAEYFGWQTSGWLELRQSTLTSVRQRFLGVGDRQPPEDADLGDRPGA